MNEYGIEDRYFDADFFTVTMVDIEAPAVEIYLALRRINRLIESFVQTERDFPAETARFADGV